VLLAFAVAAVALTWVPLRSARHAVPVLDLPALGVPTLWLACVTSGVFAAGFAAMLFGNVLFLTSVWHDSVLLAGLSLAPGPLMVVPTSILGGRFVHRFGPGPIVALGGVSFGLGVLIWVLRMDSTRDYVGAMLPGQLLTGIGVGLILPSLSGVVGTVLPAARWGAGSSMVNTTRQIGTVLGIAVLVAIFAGTPDLTDFRRGWLLILATAITTSVGGLLIATRRRTDHHVEPSPALVVPAQDVQA
jgi:MFS family permease